MNSLAARQLARVIIAMQPYVDDIVLVGGWVHAFYLAEANDVGAVVTEYIDVTVPRVLLTRDRLTLLELAAKAGFERDPISDMDDVAAWMVYRNADGFTVPIDFLAQGAPATTRRYCRTVWPQGAGVSRSANAVGFMAMDGSRPHSAPAA